jgi:FkbM family methyltransferase
VTWHIPDGDTYFATLLTPEGFEIDHLKEALKFCRGFQVAIDGGAHIGTWSAYMATKFERVLAFEPAKDSFDCLVKNTEQFSNVVCQNVALGVEPGRCTMRDDPARLGNTGARMTFLGSGDIPVITIDQLELTTLDFLKLDLEGYEIRALLGASKTIERCSPTIVVECKEFNPIRMGGVKVVKDHLNSLGYVEVGGVRNDRVFVP